MDDNCTLVRWCHKRKYFFLLYCWC